VDTILSVGRIPCLFYLFCNGAERSSEFAPRRIGHHLTLRKGFSSVTLPRSWFSLCRRFSDSSSTASGSANLATGRTREVRDRKKHQQDDRHEHCFPVASQVMREERADPRECEAGICPLLEFRQAGDNKSDCPQEFGGAKNNAELLRVPDVRKSFDGLRGAG
jgi:hypothetical protein